MAGEDQGSAIEYKRQDLIASARAECRRRITRDVYGASDAMDELFVRVAGEETVDQREQRAAMLDRYHNLKAMIRHAAVGPLYRIDPHADEHWR